jgi:putative molybdopterin biosynthesis protein
LIDEWIETSAKTGFKEALQKSRRIAGALLAAGSNDPVLDILQAYMRRSYPEFYIFSANIGSVEGLAALNNGYTDIAWSHLLYPQTGVYNIPYISQYLPDIKAVVVNLFYRELGFVTARDNPFHVAGFGDLAYEGIRIINRQKGSGTRLLLDFHLERLGISPASVSGYEQEVYTHFDVGVSVLSGAADVGIATGAVSKLLDLPFIPITRESFDMVLEQTTFFERGVQNLIVMLKAEDFRKRVTGLGSYDFKDSGKILYSTS